MTLHEKLAVESIHQKPPGALQCVQKTEKRYVQEHIKPNKTKCLLIRN